MKLLYDANKNTMKSPKPKTAEELVDEVSHTITCAICEKKFEDKYPDWKPENSRIWCNECVDKKMNKEYCPHLWSILERNTRIKGNESTKTITKKCLKCGEVKTEKEAKE